MFLSLLKPGGRMVVVIDEEAVLITRNGEDAHDFVREVSEGGSVVYSPEGSAVVKARANSGPLPSEGVLDVMACS